MIYYYSAPTNYEIELKECKIKSFLLSYAIDGNMWERFYNNEIPLLIDSGAFTIWNSGKKKVNVQEYRKFCEKLPDNCIFVNLDIIPITGSKQSDVDKCCNEGFDNFLYLRDYLKNVMPVYHYKDNIKYLHKYLEYTKYIGISPANDTNENIKKSFFNYVFKNIDLDIKTHAFGYSS